ncbi:hypothetical protein [Herminiimonas arsenitoxidans]|uniref:hypothetical protein n=1 Tax=Herminiimonas arsenitoxidans TaxID=1809410 RepID=UPI0012FFBDF5|nr:hypothetical protein [Herminiimonas arsenitoxidans]
MQPRVGTSDNDLLPIITRLSKQYHIPYSEAHLRDLASGHSEENKHYSNRDIQFLTNLTGSKAVVFVHEEKTGAESLAIQSRNIEADFAAILQIVNSEERGKVNLSMYSKERVPIDLSLLEEDIFLAKLIDNGGTLDASVMQRILVMLWESHDDPESYKWFRRQVQKIVDNIESRPTALIKNFPAVHAEILPLFKYLSLQEYDEIQKVFTSALFAFAKFSGRNFQELTFGATLELAYNLLDFHPFFAEKINEKNRPSNQLRDMKHLYSASKAKFFVTQDRSSLKKSRFITQALGMKVKVLDVSEFIARFS